MNLLEKVYENPFLLAPMAGITDSPFRSFMRELGCGVVTTELVSATGFQFASAKTKRLMTFTPDQDPVGIQIFGENLEHLAYIAQGVEQMGANFVDLNFGCPVNKVVKKGAGAGVLKDLKALTEILRTVKKAVNIPVTIKIRTGWDDQSRNADQVSHIAYNEGITWVAIHGRSRAQAYLGTSDWDYIKSVKQQARLPIIGNGDLTSPEKAVEYLNTSGCDAVMIGRGALKNPLLFKQALNLYTKEKQPVASHISHLIDRLSYHLQSHYDEFTTGLQLKKFASWYSSGYPQSTQFRRQVFQLKKLDEIQESTKEFFQTLPVSFQKDTSEEAFLRGGHG